MKPATTYPITILIALLCSIFLISSCGKDDDDETENKNPEFSCNFEWKEGVNLNSDPIDNLPANISITWDDITEIDRSIFENENLPEVALWTTTIEDGVVGHIIFAQDIIGQDTVLLNFIVYDDVLQAKRYEIANGDLLTTIFQCLFECEDGIEFPTGVAIPLFSLSQSEEFSLLTLFGLTNFNDDAYLEIESIEPETNRITGSFDFEMKFAEGVTLDDGQSVENIPIVKVTDGYFNKVPFAESE